MLTRAEGRTLSQLIAIRMGLVAIALSLLLFVGFFVRYALDAPLVRRLTLQAAVDSIAQALRYGEDPAAWKLYRDYPQAYGFRVIEIRPNLPPKVSAAANTALLPKMDSDPDDFDLVPGMGSQSSASTDGNTRPPAKWLLTDYVRDGNVVRWIQVAMIGDPARRWILAIAGELRSRIFFPILLIVPALTLAGFLATRRALQPLVAVGRHAQMLAESTTPNGQFAPLPAEKLPLELRAVIAAVNRVLAQLDDSLTLQRQFTSDVAHELRTPLAVVLLELSELPPGPSVDHFRSELFRLRDIINELLHFAQAEAAMAQQRRTVVDIAALARRVCEDLAVIAFNQHKAVEFDAPDREVFVSGYATLIEIALRNLVDNAIKATPKHSSVAVSVTPDRSIVVEDCGVGVPANQRYAIFKRFWHADSSNGGGTGIGLALVRRVALLHGGAVRVQDRAGGGARFVLTLATDTTAVRHSEIEPMPAPFRSAA